MSTENVSSSPKAKTIVRIVKNRDFLQVSHIPLYDVALSLKAKGLLCIMLSMADEWEFRREHLLTLCADGRDSLRAALKELQQAKYVTLNSERDERGRIQKWIMSVHEVPTNYRSSEIDSRSGFSASGEKPIESRDVDQLSRSGFSTCGKPVCNNTNNNNNINNNNSVVEKIKSRIKDIQAPDIIIESWIEKYGEGYILSKIKLLWSKPRTNPLGWLIKAIENDYSIQEEAVVIPPAREIWSEEKQAKKNREAERFANSNDWRDAELEKYIEGLRAQHASSAPVALKAALNCNAIENRGFKN